MPPQAPPMFTPTERDVLYDIISARRDMRHFLPDQSIDHAVLQRLFAAAHMAPSVGLMQPWRFIRITQQDLRQRIAVLVEAEIQRTAAHMGVRKAEFLALKVEGVRTCAELLVVLQAPDDGTVFGRRTLPEMALCSVACAIENLWLAARAENLGLGWVSLFEPAELAALLRCPEGAKPIAILCVGPVQAFYDKPMLEALDWRTAKDLSAFVFQDYWTESAG